MKLWGLEFCPTGISVHLAPLHVPDEKLDMVECVIYKSVVDQKVWVRPRVEFVDRFIKVM